MAGDVRSDGATPGIVTIPLSAEEIDAEARRLAGLSIIEYDLQRIVQAERLGINVGTLDSMVKSERARRKKIEKAAAENRRRYVEQSSLADDAAGNSPEYSDDALALAFSERHGMDLRYTARFGQWHRWDGYVWREDDTVQVFTKARAICREHANRVRQQSENSKEAKGVASAKTVAAVVSLARSDPRHATSSDDWDADIWSLNTPAGLIDLRTGLLSAPDPMRYCTKSAGAKLGDDDATLGCPQWLAFLNRVMAGNQALVDFLQRMAGYCLTGSTREHALFFLYGTGANGKSVFISTISAVLADYQLNAPAEVFMENKQDRHSTELARLRGARLVTVVETEEGRRWNEARIKALTGGDRITARFMRQDDFEYTPQFKLVIAGNHRPSLRTIDEAIRRRMNLIPFSVTIPPEQRDPDLTAKLRAELPGILAWMLQGCLTWQQHGLQPPNEVKEATAAYLSAEDSFATWLDDCCNRQADGFETGANLYKSYRAWSEQNGEFTVKARRFREKMEAAGFDQDRKNSQRGYSGISLKLMPNANNYNDVD